MAEGSLPGLAFLRMCPTCFRHHRGEGKWPPHFHAIYGEYETRVVIETGEFLDEGFPARARRLVEECVALHTEELLRNWEKAREGTPLDRIDPLP